MVGLYIQTVSSVDALIGTSLGKLRYYMLGITDQTQEGNWCYYGTNTQVPFSGSNSSSITSSYVFVMSATKYEYRYLLL